MRHRSLTLLLLTTLVASVCMAQQIEPQHKVQRSTLDAQTRAVVAQRQVHDAAAVELAPSTSVTSIYGGYNTPMDAVSVPPKPIPFKWVKPKHSH